MVGLVFVGQLVVAPGELRAQTCENCLGQNGGVEPCDSNEGRSGFTDCVLLLGFFCYGTHRCDIIPTDALALGMDGWKTGQLTRLELTGRMEATSALADQTMPTSGPWSPGEDGPPPLRAWVDCTGAITGIYRTDAEIRRIAQRTAVFEF